MIYENVKKLVVEKGLNIAKLEQKAGLSNGSIVKWKKSSPKVDSLKSVADVLGVKIEKLLEE